MYQLLMPIGDPTDDGHGKCAYFFVLSNKPYEEVKKIHYKAKDETGIDIERICSDYEDNFIFDEDMERIKDIGFDISKIENSDNTDMYYPNSEQFALLWLFLLMKTDPTLKMEIKSIPTMDFASVGYGLFW